MNTSSRFFLWLIAFFATCNCCTAQMRDSVLKYYSFKNTAELYILESNYKAANDNYKNAFRNKTPNLLDIYNAFVVATLSGDSSQVKFIFSELALHGMQLHQFEKMAFPQSIAGTPFYLWITDDYDSLTAINNIRIDRQYIKFLDSVYNRDQGIRYAKGSDDEMRTSDQANIRELKLYIGQHGYPSYDKVGMYEASYEGWLHYFSTIWLVLLHTRHLSNELNPLLLQAVQSGKMSAADYATLTDFQLEKPTFYSVLPKTISNDGEVRLHLPDSADIINERRKSIGLESLQDYKRKLDFSRIDKRFYFVPMYLKALQYARFDMSKF